jgi:hypothetical protein
MKRTVKYILFVALALAVSGCGYTIKRSPVTSVRIGDIENMTTEAKLDDRMTEALVSSFMKNGIKVSGGSDHSIEGTLESLELEQLAEEDEVTTSYQVIIEGQFFLVGPDGERTKLPGAGKYIVSFGSTGRLTPVIARKELAIQRALNNVAEEISAAVLYMK